MNLDRSPFNILGVDRNCSDKDVKDAYRRMVMRYHPDRNKSPDSEAKFKQIQVAHELIRTASGRALIRKIEASAARKQSGQAHFAQRGKSPDLDPSAWGSQAYRGEYTYQEKSTVEASIYVKFALKLILQPQRLLANMLVYGFFTILFSNAAKVGLILEVSALFNALLLALVCSLVTELIQYHFLMVNSRHELRAQIGNLVAWSALSSAAIFVGAIEFTGFSLIPDLLGLDPGNVRSSMLFVFCSSVYFWLCYCLLTHRYNRHIDFAFILSWMLAALYFLITVLRFNVFSSGAVT